MVTSKQKLKGNAMLLDNNKYLNVVSAIKKEISSAQHRAMFSVNKELILLYWQIGTIINVHTEWGNKFIENLSRDIRLDFPNMKGYSVRNLKYMAKFADTYKDIQIVQQLVAQLSWGHNIILMDKIKDNAERVWYIEYALKDMSKPIGVSEYKLTDYLPKEFEKSLPSTQDIESRIKACIDTIVEDEQ